MLTNDLRQSLYCMCHRELWHILMGVYQQILAFRTFRFDVVTSQSLTNEGDQSRSIALISILNNLLDLLRLMGPSMGVYSSATLDIVVTHRLGWHRDVYCLLSLSDM